MTVSAAIRSAVTTGKGSIGLRRSEWRAPLRRGRENRREKGRQRATDGPPHSRRRTRRSASRRRSQTAPPKLSRTRSGAATGRAPREPARPAFFRGRGWFRLPREGRIPATAGNPEQQKRSNRKGHQQKKATDPTENNRRGHPYTQQTEKDTQTQQTEKDTHTQQQKRTPKHRGGWNRRGSGRRGPPSASRAR